jgi:thioredoxin-dependent peroxiredoxin
MFAQGRIVKDGRTPKERAILAPAPGMANHRIAMMPRPRFRQEIQGACRMLAAGNRAPDFTARDQNDQPVTLSDLLKSGALILYFYPADFTPGCTREACSLRDVYPQLIAAKITVAGVSPQSPQSHAAFAAKYALPFTLLCDPDKVLARAYKVVGPLGFGVRRASFLISPAGMIEDAVLADLRIGRHEAFFRKAATASR